MARDDRHPTQRDLDNHSRQLDPEHDSYWKSRGEEERPEDWTSRRTEEGHDERQ